MMNPYTSNPIVTPPEGKQSIIDKILLKNITDDNVRKEFFQRKLLVPVKGDSAGALVWDMDKLRFYTVASLKSILNEIK